MYSTIKRKMIITILSVVTLISAVVGIGFLAKHKDKAPVASVEEPSVTITDENDTVFDGEEVHAMPARMLISRSPMLAKAAENQMVSTKIAANISPYNATDKTVDWSLVFVNAESEWATGKTVTDYVTAIPETGGALVATVSCTRPFGEQIKLTVTSRDNPGATASCLIDYKQTLTGYTLSVEQSGKTATVDNDIKTGMLYADFSVEMPITVNYALKKSDVYTVPIGDDEVSAPKLSAEYKSGLVTAINAIKANSCVMPVVEESEKGFIVKNVLDKNFIGDFGGADFNKAVKAVESNKSKCVIIKLKDTDGNILAEYSFNADTTAIKSVVKVEGITLDETTFVFGGPQKTYKIIYRAAGYTTEKTLFEAGSEFGLSKQTDGSYPETYTYGETATVSNLKTSFSCGGQGNTYHSGSGYGRAEYSFSGWYLDYRCTVPFNGTIPAGTVGNITLYAKINTRATHNY